MRTRVEVIEHDVEREAIPRRAHFRVSPQIARTTHAQQRVQQSGIAEVHIVI